MGAGRMFLGSSMQIAFGRCWERGSGGLDNRYKRMKRGPWGLKRWMAGRGDVARIQLKRGFVQRVEQLGHMAYSTHLGPPAR